MSIQQLTKEVTDASKQIGDKKIQNLFLRLCGRFIQEFERHEQEIDALKREISELKLK